MKYPEIIIKKHAYLELEQFKKMDYYAVENYALPIELMMENAGLNLAKLIASSTNKTDLEILIGIGNGNNGGGGLVAARRLAGWGYNVHLDIASEINKELPLRQLERAVKFGVKNKAITHPHVWVDAYLGFSQHLPLSQIYTRRIEEANYCNCQRISLDIPTGFLGNIEKPYFKADKILTLAAPKKILYKLPKEIEIYIADLGIPKSVYKKFGIDALPFNVNSILRVK